jgi:hypothetical protein
MCRVESNSIVDEFQDQDCLPFFPVYETFLENILDYFESESDFSIKEIADMESAAVYDFTAAT